MPEPDSGPSEPRMPRLGHWTLLAVALGITVVFFLVIRPFVMALLMAAVVSGMTYALYQRLTTLLRGRHRLASVLMILLMLVLVVVPATAFVGVLTNQALGVSQSVGPWIQEQVHTPGALEQRIGTRVRSIPLVGAWIPEREVILKRLGEAAGGVGRFLVGGLASAAQGTMRFLLQLFIMLYAMYFFYVSGAEGLKRVLYLFPLESSQEDRLLRRFVSVTRATLKGTLVIGLVQGGLAGVAFWVAGIPGAVFWGTIMAVLSIIPAVGAALVWIPADIYLFATGQVAAGVGLLVWCGVVVSSADNVLRPRLVGRDTQMPDLLVLLSTLGGIALFGMLGFIVGPIVAALFLTVWELYGEAFGKYLPGGVGQEGAAKEAGA